MCTLAVFRGISPIYPLVVAANRDEFLGRRSAPPGRWSELPPLAAGRDLEAGGTWLGCRLDGSGRVAGLLNRRPALDRPSAGPGQRSRGLLCVDALTASSTAAHLASLDAREAARYGGFNLFVADLEGARVADNGDGLRIVELETGLSVLTNLDVNDPRCPRLAGASRRFSALVPLLAAEADVEDAVPALASVLSSHEAGADDDGNDDPARLGALPFSKICVHVRDYGTRSSSILFVRPDGRVRWFHADGPPCTTAFHELAL